MSIEPKAVWSFRDYIRVIFRHKTVIALCIVTVCVTVFIGLQLKTPEYEAKVKMLITGEQKVEAAYYRDLSNSHGVEVGLTRSEIVKSNPMIKTTVEALKLFNREIDYEKEYATKVRSWMITREAKSLQDKLDEMDEKTRTSVLYRRAVESLKARVAVQPIRDTNIFEIRVRDYNSSMAALIANVISRAYMIFDLQQQQAELRLKYGLKHPLIKQINDHIFTMQLSLTGGSLTVNEAIGPGTVKIIEEAIAPIKHNGKPKAMILSLAFMMSAFLGIMLAFIFDALDNTVKSPAELLELVPFPLISSVSKRTWFDSKLIKGKTARGARSMYIDSYRNLADQIQLLRQNEKLSVIQLTGPQRNEGVTTTMLNLGYYLADEMGLKVLLIDANFRDQQCERMLKQKKCEGLAEVLTDNRTLDRLKIQLADHVDILLSGYSTVNPMRLLDSDRMKDVIEQARREYDVVLIDSPNLRYYNDALVFGRIVDGTLCVIAEGNTRRQVILNAVKPLTQPEHKVLGIILNKRRYVIPNFIYQRV